jgi:DNA-directed RNA polymerase
MQTQALPTTSDNAQVLIAAQRDIELRSTKDGYDRYIKAQQSNVDNLGGHAGAEAVKMIRGSIPLVSAKIREWLDANNANTGRGKRHAALSTLTRLDPDLLAFITMNTIFGAVTKITKLATVHTLLGKQIEAEIMALDIEEARGAKVAKRIHSATVKQGSARNKRKVFNKLANEQLPEHVAWDQVKALRMAEPLISAALEALSDMLEVITLPIAKNRTETTIRLSDEGVQMFGQLRESMAWMQPIHRPMVVPPRPWTAIDTGCYYEQRSAHAVKLVRTFNKDHRKLVKQAIADGQMDYVLKAVNTVQSTAWSINHDIYALVQWAFDAGVDGLGLPSNNLMAIPPRMDKDAWDAMTPRDRKGHRINMAGIHERNRGTVSDQAVLLRDLETAKELTAYHSFWLPHNLDFRGRVYPVPHFNQQRQDHIKAMFQFSDGQPLGEYGAAWLSIHLANCGDFEKVSKKSFDARQQWVEDNEFLILSIGKDPKATVDHWRKADSPFMFVAACIDYYRWVQSGRSDSYVSHLAVALDGSNSGLQHYSAALRSKEEAAFVSLLPCDTPADLYQTVADKVLVRMLQEAADGSELAQQCIDIGITRSLVKRNVMTFAYSSEQFGFRKQLMDDLMRPLNDEVFTGKIAQNPWAVFRKDKTTGELTDELDGGFTASGYLAAQVWKAVTATVTNATEGMDFFKKVAATLAHERLPLIWTTPLGLPVVHRYDIWETKTVNMFLYDRKLAVTEAAPSTDPDAQGTIRRVRANIRTAPTGRIDKDKARSAVAPNVIHSMDGSHLLLTVLNAEQEGYMDFALIHDSFGVHAGKTQRFFGIIRESFVEMYDDYCPFEEVLDYAKSTLSDEGILRLPDMPTKGDMDLTDVLDAHYAFA